MSKPSPESAAELDDDVELILDEWEKGKIHTIYSREQLKRRLYKVKEHHYRMPIPPDAITDAEINFIIEIKPGLFLTRQKSKVDPN